MTTGYKVIILDFSEAAHMDTSAAMAIDELIHNAQGQQTYCILAGVTGTAETTLRSLNVLNDVEPGNCTPTRREGILRAAALLA